MNLLTLLISGLVYCFGIFRYAFVVFFDAIVSAFRNYFSFKGRANRAQFWCFFLFCILLYLLTLSLSIDGLQELVTKTSSEKEDAIAILTYLASSWFGLAVMITFIPQITLSVRRLHDIGKSGWWYVGLQVGPSLLPNFLIFQFIAILTFFIFVYFMAMESEDDNQYGPNPLKN